MSSIKERLFGAIAVMEEKEAYKLWDFIMSQHRDGWDEIEEEEPDEIDLEIVHEAGADPDCKEMASSEEVAQLFI